MAAAEQGNTVRVHYSGFLEDGTIFDSSLERDPLEFTVGEQTVIPGFDAAVVGMEIGGTKTVAIPPADAYGDRDEQMVAVIERSRVPDDIDPKPGAVLQISPPRVVMPRWWLPRSTTRPSPSTATTRWRGRS